MSSENNVKENLKEWVLKVSKKADAGHLDFETDLLTSRIISSLQIMDLILEIEKLKGSPVQMKNIKPGVFKSINSIYSAFFTGAAQ